MQLTSFVLLQRFAACLAGVWAGFLLALAALVAPALFRILPSQQAGEVAAYLFQVEAYVSVLVGVVLLLLIKRQQWGWDAGWVLFALFCVVLGYFVLQPEMAALRPQLADPEAKQRFAMLHLLSSALYALRLLAALLLSWRLSKAAVLVDSSANNASR